MNKKTIVITVISIILFAAISVGIFFGIYNLMGSLIRNNPEVFTEEVSRSPLTKEELLDLSDEDLEYEIINDIWYFKIGEDSENEFELASKLPDSMRYVYAIWTFEAEFYDGGFPQFFYSYSGEFAEDAMEGYKFFNAPEHAALMAEAIEIYKEEEELYKKAADNGSTVAFTSLYKQSKLADLDAKLDPILDKATESRIKYIRDNIDEFVIE